jgi:hypothetical protein
VHYQPRTETDGPLGGQRFEWTANEALAFNVQGVTVSDNQWNALYRGCLGQS